MHIPGLVQGDLMNAVDAEAESAKEDLTRTQSNGTQVAASYML